MHKPFGAVGDDLENKGQHEGRCQDCHHAGHAVIGVDKNTHQDHAESSQDPYGDNVDPKLSHPTMLERGYTVANDS